MAPDPGDAALETIFDDTDDPGAIAATDGRVPGRRGLATRTRLLECTAELLAATPWRSIKVIDIARQAGTSPATFYQYFENVEQAILVMAEELMQGAGTLAELVDGDWSDEASWATARRVVEGFMALLGGQPGRLPGRRARHRGGRPPVPGPAGARPQRRDGHPRPGDRVGRPERAPAGADAMAVAATLISMLAHVAAHRYGFEFWGIRTTAMVDTQATRPALGGDGPAAHRRRSAPWRHRAPVRWWGVVPPRPRRPRPAGGPGPTCRPGPPHRAR